MKKIKTLIIYSVFGIICFCIGAYLGGKYSSKKKIQLLIDMMAMDESYQLKKSAAIYEALNKGKEKEVKFLLYVDINNFLKNKRAYDSFALRRDTVERLKENEKQIKEIFERYPEPRLSEENNEN